MKIFELFSNIKHSQAFFFIELSDESDQHYNKLSKTGTGLSVIKNDNYQLYQKNKESQSHLGPHKCVIPNLFLKAKLFYN